MATFWWVRESDSPLYSSQQSISKSIYYSPIVCCRNPPTFWWVRESDSPLYSSQQSISKSIIIVQLSVAETPPPFGGSVSLTLPYTVQQTIAIININMPM